MKRPHLPIWFLAAMLAWLLANIVAARASDSLQDLPALRKRMEELHRAAKFTEELRLAQEALTISETSSGPHDPDTAKSLKDLGDVYVSLGDYPKAEPLYLRAKKIDDEAVGSDSPTVADTLNKLGKLYILIGSYPKAEPILQRALQIREKTLGPNHLDTAGSLNNLATLYFNAGDYAKAEPLHQRALQIRENVLGPDHPDTAASCNNLANLYWSMGDYSKAEPLYQRALQIREKTRGPDHPDTAGTCNNLANLYWTMGDYPKAEPLYQRALHILEKALGVDHPDTATSVNNLADLYQSIGDYLRAEPLYLRALQIREKTLGLDHPDTATSVTNLADLYQNLGDYNKAKSFYERALHILEKALGPDHPDTGTSVGNLAVLCLRMDDYAGAGLLSQRALRIDEKAHGPNHPSTAISLSNLAAVYQSSGDYIKAEPLYRRALQIDEKAFGSNHPITALTLTALALLYIDENKLSRASVLLPRLKTSNEKHLSSILSFTSEQERLAFQKTVDPLTVAATLSDDVSVTEIILRSKGIVLDSLLEDRLVAEASQDLRLGETVTRLRAAKQRLMQLLLETPQDLSEDTLKKGGAEKRSLSRQIDELEAGLGREVASLGRARRALSITVPQVRSALATNESLIEVMRYSHYLGKNKFETRYGAAVVSRGRGPKWIPLGAAADIDKNIQVYQKSVRGETDEPMLRRVLHSLDRQLWAPIKKALPHESTTIVISPDAEVNFVSFATLIGSDDKFLGEKYSIRYVASGRDLLPHPRVSQDQRTLVFANPDFGSTLAPTDSSRRSVALRSTEMGDLKSIFLQPLPGTAVEAVALEKRAKEPTKVFLGSNATEAELRQVNAPRVLHLATHGFFLPEMELDDKRISVLQREQNIPRNKLVNPMHRSGLALAGAQTTLMAWGRDEVPPTESDGIVTAEEVGGLKLDTTWLVVLSACETGSGEARAGEGVMGLRRGFVQAGTQNLLMTLWSISDEVTVQIMLDFYDAAFRTGNAPQALADTQRDWLVKLRRERGLLSAVQLAGPFIMSSQGKP
jgi:tetratricopeptide (TPR) repeat protein